MRTWTRVAAVKIRDMHRFRNENQQPLLIQRIMAMREKEVSRMAAKCLACSSLDGGAIY